MRTALYYISSRNLTALELLHHARMEWAVESMHWILDVHYSEDFCRIVNRTIQQNLNMLRKFAFSLIKLLLQRAKIGKGGMEEEVGNGRGMML